MSDACCVAVPEPLYSLLKDANRSIALPTRELDFPSLVLSGTASGTALAPRRLNVLPLAQAKHQAPQPNRQHESDIKRGCLAHGRPSSFGNSLGYSLVDAGPGFGYSQD